jgi:hypothetical protein
MYTVGGLFKKDEILHIYKIGRQLFCIGFWAIYVHCAPLTRMLAHI